MHAFIIRSGQRNLAELEAALMQCGIESISYVPGVFLDESQISQNKRVDLPRAEILLGRRMSISEVGCAMAHNEARKRASQLNDFSLILEDDAVIPNPLILRVFLEKFKLQFHIGSNVVANLAIDAPWSHVDNEEQTKSKLKKSLGPSPLALAYLVTPRSSENLLNANDPVQYLSDWPPANVGWVRAIKPPVFHGTIDSKSLISPDQGKYRSRETLKFKLFRYLFIEYFIRHNEYRGFTDFFTTAWLPRVKSAVTYKIGI